MKLVELDQHAVGDAHEGVGGAHGGGEGDFAVGGDAGGLDDGPLKFAEHAAAHGRLQGGKVQIEETGFALVDLAAERRVGLVGRAPGDGLGLGERAVEGRSGGGAGDDADLERPAGGVFGLGAGGDRQRDDFTRAGGGETAETDRVAMVNEGGRFVGRQGGERQAHRRRLRVMCESLPD